MIDVSEYVGLPYAPVGRGPVYDCYGLIQLVYRERLGIELQEQTGYVDTLCPETAALLEAGKRDWRQVDTPSPWDVVLFRVDGMPNHIGLVIAPGWMLHTTRAKQSCIENYTRPQWRSRIEGFYSYAGDHRPPASAA